MVSYSLYISCLFLLTTPQCRMISFSLCKAARMSIKSTAVETSDGTTIYTAWYNQESAYLPQQIAVEIGSMDK